MERKLKVGKMRGERVVLQIIYVINLGLTYICPQAGYQVLKHRPEPFQIELLSVLCEARNVECHRPFLSTLLNRQLALNE